MQDNLIEIRDLRVAFNGHEVVHGVSLDIRRGECLALVGESGSGKSVTAHSILRLLPAKTVSTQGSIRYDGLDLVTASDKQLRSLRGNRVAMIFQEPMSSLNPLHTVEKQIGEILVTHKGLKGKAALSRTLELLELVGIRDPLSRLKAYPHQLSGGQRQRVMIAMALANEPDLLVADEPTTALDVTVQVKILELLKSLQQRLNMSLLLISHDLNLVRRIAQRVCVMREGEIVEQADCQTLFDSPQHPYSRLLINAEPDGEPVPSTHSNTLLSVQDLKVWFPLGKAWFKREPQYVKAVDGVSFELLKGKTLGIVGESGSGKSTLGQAILRLVDSEGSIRFGTKELSLHSQHLMRPLRRQLQVVFQDPFGSLSPRMTVEQIIAEGLVTHNIGTPKEREQTVIRVLQEVGLDPATRHRYPHEFSGGQRQRISIARALVLEPDLILLDEPTSALDRTVQKQIVALLRDLQIRHGLTYLFISHDLAVVHALAHDLIVIKDGKVVEQGPSRKIFAAPQQAYTQELLRSSGLVFA
ncbi:ABC transporter ATP-binding protein [Pseudomonas cannabina]|uniref:ABC-type dipeptide transporter n=1 Tax=Pseudomonas syringae pv. maculicola str. ES4326 TaxID=629265 RepID=A0A8T8BVU7_PSEYM|nr:MULTISPECIES: ABC transporter ATP-binding protein [Pseudomonas syringae group]KPB70101.1 Peptide ABC transporter ATP-binding protein [Pseudomonas syringae pv. maculicola]QHE95247.1 dipeptide ABC transporter ATP-binding protein [Pseudomonas syringae pv. maculicola str. ES4326]QQN22232.1 ABC transporter ATP-binding protein [Pseudomonas cannabina pv. alisalensis]UBY95877.1 ABC transporter ATP-binding protein [Pseudomonas cannabina pv. alisalensis]